MIDEARFDVESAKGIVNELDLVRCLKVLYGSEGEVTVPAKLFALIFAACPPVDRFVNSDESRVHLMFGGFKIVAGDK